MFGNHNNWTRASHPQTVRLLALVEQGDHGAAINEESGERTILPVYLLTITIGGPRTAGAGE
jgi:hypothetical protein